jgi:hypothetical protein
MSFKSSIISAALLAVTMPQLANAQALKGVRTPANLPPADYTGVQYVDNKGCIFVRAGRLGAVNWVPRVDQSRKHMCAASYTPTFPSTTDIATNNNTKPVTKPVAAANLDRGKVEYKGAVIKPVEAPDTSMVQTKEAKPAAKVSEAAKAAKAAAAKAVSDEQNAKAAAQTKIADKMKADALAKRKADEKLKAAQMAEAMKQAEEATKVKSQIAEKVAKDKEERNAQRAAAKAARATALAEKKAAQAAARATASAARKAKIAKAKSDLLGSKNERLAKKQAAEQARLEKIAARKAAKEAKTVAKPAVKPVNTAKVDREAEMAAKKAAAQEAKTARASAAAAKKAAAKKAKMANASAAANAFKPGFYVDLGANLSAEKAATVEKRLLASGYRVKTQISGNASRVYAGPFRSSSNARVAVYQVVNEGYKRATIIKK